MVETVRAPIGWPGTAPESAASFPLAQSSMMTIENEDEWEYEYSATETEVLFLLVHYGQTMPSQKEADVLCRHTT